ncbi:MAG: hypothetical protein K9N52_09120 [Verrucomicrobia bacterium]|nr:hypothetical protein [Verrucomicrobiota bacterium]
MKTTLLAWTVFGLVLSAATNATAETYTFTGAESADWTSTNNWNPAGLPGPGDTVKINSGTLEIDTNATITDLEFQGGGIGGSGTLTVNGSMVWTSGSLRDSGTNVIAQGASLLIDGTGQKQWYNRRLVNHGNVTWNEGGIYAPGALLLNAEDGVLEIAANAELKAGNIINHGTIRKLDSSAEFTLFAGSFKNYSNMEIDAGGWIINESSENQGHIQVSSGTMTFGGGTLNSGTLTTGTNGIIYYSGKFTNSTGAVLTGAGRHIITDDYFIVNGETEAGNLEFQGGRIGGSGTLTVNGSMVWSSGSLLDSGTNVIAQGASLLIDGTGQKQWYNRRLVNHGTVTWNEGGIYAPGALLLNAEDGVLEIVANASMRGIKINNHGTIRVDGPDTEAQFSSNSELHNYGVIELLQGTLMANNCDLQGSGAIRVHAVGHEPLIGYGQLVVDGTLTLNGALRLSFGESFSPQGGHEFTVVSAKNIVGAFASFESNEAINGLFANPTYTDTKVICVMQDPTPHYGEGTISIDSGIFKFRMFGLAGKTYVLERSSDLIEWIPIQTNEVPGCAYLDMQHELDTQKRYEFYRSRYQPKQ